MEDLQKMEHEGNVASLLENHSQDGANDVTLPTMASTSTPPVRNDELKGINNLSKDDESQRMNIEGTMASLLEADPDNITE